MSIQLVTYANQTVTPTNDAIIYEKAVDQNGIFYGCNVTVTSNNVNITGGYGIVCGREFVINSESIAVTLAPSGTLEGRLYVRLDLADADAPIQLLTATGNSLPPLVQDDDVNYTNGTYEMELATFTVGVSSLSDCVETFETIVGRATAIENGITSHSDLIHYDGSENIATGGSVKNLIPEFTLPSSGMWLIISDVQITSSGSSSANLQNRLLVNGVDYYVQYAAIKQFHSYAIAIASSGTVSLNTFQNTGSTQTVAYNLNCIKLI